MVPAFLPETDCETNSGELRTAATVGSGVVVLPARTYTVNYGFRNNKRVRVRVICRAQLAATDRDAEHGNGKRAARRTRQQTRRRTATKGWPAAARRSGGGGRRSACVRAREELWRRGVRQGHGS